MENHNEIVSIDDNVYESMLKDMTNILKEWKYGGVTNREALREYFYKTTTSTMFEQPINDEEEGMRVFYENANSLLESDAIIDFDVIKCEAITDDSGKPLVEDNQIMMELTANLWVDPSVEGGSQNSYLGY